MMNEQTNIVDVIASECATLTEEEKQMILSLIRLLNKTDD